MEWKRVSAILYSFRTISLGYSTPGYLLDYGCGIIILYIHVHVIHVYVHLLSS